jgi:hypothetical protein
MPPLPRSDTLDWVIVGIRLSQLLLAVASSQEDCKGEQDTAF